MKKAVLVMLVASFAVVMLAAPVMAIGPGQAFEVGNNKNLVPFGAALGNLRGGASGSLYWFWVASDNHWVKWEFQDPRQAKGIMNNALVAPQYSGLPSGLPAYFATLNDPEFDNTWIYLSGDGTQYPSQYMNHGMLYWFTFGIAKLPGASNADAAAKATQIVTTYPAGELWKHNDINAPL